MLGIFATVKINKPILLAYEFSVANFILDLFNPISWMGVFKNLLVSSLEKGGEER